jgi:hypothetical protein
MWEFLMFGDFGVIPRKLAESNGKPSFGRIFA